MMSFHSHILHTQSLRMIILVFTMSYKAQFIGLFSARKMRVQALHLMRRFIISSRVDAQIIIFARFDWETMVSSWFFYDFREFPTRKSQTVAHHLGADHLQRSGRSIIAACFGSGYLTPSFEPTVQWCENCWYQCSLIYI